MKSSSIFKKNFCPSCRLAVSKDTGRLKWCGGEEWDKCRRGRCRILFMLPILLLPAAIVFIVVSHLSGRGSVLAATQHPPDPAPTPPPLDHSISADQQADPTAPIIFEQPILLEPELAELKAREWLREPKTSFIPPASHRLQMSRVQKRMRRDIEGTQKYPVDESDLSDIIVWKEVPSQSKRGLNFDDFMTSVRKKTNSTITQLEDATHKLFQSKNTKDKNSSTSANDLTTEEPDLPILDEMIKNREEKWNNEEKVTTKETSSNSEPNTKHTFLDNMKINEMNAKRKDFDEISRLISRRYELMKLNKTFHQHSNLSDKQKTEQKSRTGRQSNQKEDEITLLNKEENAEDENIPDFYPEKDFFNQRNSADEDIVNEDFYSEDNKESEIPINSKDYPDVILDEPDYNFRGFELFDSGNKPKLDHIDETSNVNIPMKLDQIDPKSTIEYSDDLTFEKQLPEFIGKLRELEKPMELNPTDDFLPKKDKGNVLSTVNQLVSKHPFNSERNYQMTDHQGRIIQPNKAGTIRHGQLKSSSNGNHREFHHDMKTPPNYSNNLENNYRYHKGMQSNSDEKSLEHKISHHKKIVNFPSKITSNTDKNKNIHHGFIETFHDKHIKFPSPQDKNRHEHPVLQQKSNEFDSPLDSNNFFHKLISGHFHQHKNEQDQKNHPKYSKADVFHFIHGTNNNFENDDLMKKDLSDQTKSKHVRRNYFNQDSANKNFQTNVEPDSQKHKEVVGKDPLSSDFFGNDQPIDTNREEILSVPGGPGLPPSLPINEAVMAQGETLPEDYSQIKFTSRSKKSSHKESHEIRDLETPSRSFEEPPVVVDAEVPSSDGGLETIQVGGHEPPRCPNESEAEVDEGEFSSRRLEQIIMPEETESNSQESQLNSFLQDQDDPDSIRKAQASMMKRFMDETVEPCDDFYQYACGNWGRYNPIPKDKSGYDTFEMLRESLDSVLRELLEETVESVKEENQKDATIKAKHLFQSCMNYEILEQRAEKPLVRLLDELGGWPVLHSKWDPENFDWLLLTAQLRLYNNDILISEWVGPDIKNSDEYIIQLDQTSLGLPTRDYFLQPSNEIYLNAYKNYMIKIATLLGASNENATRHAEELIEFETRLAKITSSPNERRNVSELYQRMTLGSLRKQVPQINWVRYMSIVLARPVRPTEPVVVFALRYLQDLVTLLGKSKPSTIADYLLWRFVRHRANNLDDRFQEAKQRFYYILFGREQAPPRWKNCISQVNSNMGMAVGAMFVQKYFDENSKNDTLDMTLEIMESFRDLLDETSWIDPETKRLAAEKVDAMTLRIGYPDFILNNEQLNERYKDVVILPEEYFENTLNILQHLTRVEQDRLGTPVNKTQWNTAPAVVNAYYSRNKNQIMFPAGILQPPFYHRYFPRSLNLGGIGVVIGHEITHGFDDKGRLFDKYGNLHRWWKDEAIQAFHQRAQCLIDQYSHYTVQEVAMQIDGVNTQGENIADNGGIKQAFKAYKRWAMTHEVLCNETLPGLNLNSEQLFFLNFAQVWCGAMRPEATRNKLKTAVHSPGRFRVIGTLSNSEDFASVFNCPSGSPMNPVNKCSVW